MDDLDIIVSLLGVMVKRAEIFKGRSVAELILILGLNQSRSLSPEKANSLEQVHYTLISHPLQNDGERDEDTGSSDSGAAVDCDRAFLAELFLGFVHLTDEVDEPFTRFRHALLRPLRELELSYCPGMAVPGVGDFEFPDDVLGHVVPL